MKTYQKIFISLASATLLSSCASGFIDVKAGAENVLVVAANQVSACESKGKVTSNVISKVWFVNRSVEGVEENLLQMARNAAVEDNANTLVKGESSQLGERTFYLYQCKR